MKFNEQILETNSNIIKSYTNSSITVLDKEYNYNVIVPPEKSIIKCSAKAKSITDSFIIDSLSDNADLIIICLLYTSPSPRDRTRSRMPSSA